MSIALAQPQLDAIAAACRRHHVARLHAFGSLLRPDYRPGESDSNLLSHEYQNVSDSVVWGAIQVDLSEP